jgi:predicted PurR-regulated permease PerM
MADSGERPPERPATLFARRRLRVVFLALVAGALLVCAYHLRDVLNPLLLSLLVAYMLQPPVRFLERRARLPRTAAVALIFLAAGGASAGVLAYSIGRTSGELDRLMTRAAGGWQRARAVESGVRREVEVSERAVLAEGATLTAEAGEAAQVLVRVPPPANPNEPVFGDDLLVPLPGSSTIFFLDLDRDGKRGPHEPIFTRGGRGAWVPVESDPASTEWRRTAGALDRLKEQIARRWALIDPKVVDAVIERAKANTASIAAAGAALWQWISDQVFGGIVTAIGYLVLVPVYTFFLVRGFDAIVARTEELLPGRHRARIRTIAARIDRACAAFFRGRSLVCLGKAAFIWLLLWAAGVEFSLTIGLIAGALSLVPFVGALVGFGLAALFSYGPSGYETRVLEAAAIFAAAEALETIVNPLFLGREVGLHPVTLLVAFFVFGDLLGFLGVLLAVPLAAVAKILLEELVVPELAALAAEKPA